MRLTPEASARRGQQVFATDCLPCHRLNGGGAAEKVRIWAGR
nr:c-type cytochrome [uncultured Rhodopila sp.]